MITTFDSSFAGSIDIDNVGYGGTAVNARHHTNEELIGTFEKAEAIAKTLDRLGYDTMWMAEHHFQPEGYEGIPNIILLAVHLSHLTQNIDFGCGFNIAPMWHPLRLAEDYATADVLTKGRLRFGVGRGYHSRELESVGAPLLDQDANRELFEEQVEVIMKAFHQESFSHHGKHYTIPPAVPYRDYILEKITLVPRPVYRSECWQPIQGGTQRQLDFMAKYGIKGTIGGGVAEGGAMENVIVGYRDALRRAGRETELGEDLNIGFHFWIAKSEEEALRQAAPLFEENLKMFGPLRLHRGLTDQQMIDINNPLIAPTADLPHIEDAARAGAFLCGTPEMIIEKLMVLGERYPGLRRITMSHPVATPRAAILEQLERLAKDVMPAFKKEAPAGVS